MQVYEATNPLNKPFLISVFTQALLYGVYVATWIYSLRWLLYEDDEWKPRTRRNINWPMFITTVLIFAFSTADLGITFRITFSLFWGEKLQSNKLGAITVTLETITILITDAVLVFRCWVVYNMSWRAIALPLTLWITCLTCLTLFDYWLIMDINYLSELSLFTPRTRTIAAAFFCCNLANNIYTTCAISYRICSYARNSRSGYLYITCRIFAESGIVCASTSLAMLITSAVKDGQSMATIVLDPVNFSTTGIAFNLILIRIGQLRTKEASHIECTEETVAKP